MSDTPTNLDDAIKQLTKLVNEHVTDGRARHDMINMISVISVSIYELRQDLQEAKDRAADEKNGKP